MSKERVLIVGGGFGGIKAALELANHPKLAITLVSDQPNFRYYPTLYRAATGGRLTNSSIPLELLFKNKRVEIIQDTATTIGKKNKILTTAAGKIIYYDTVILSLGVVTNYFGIEGLKEYSYSIKSVEEAVRFKTQLHSQLTDERRPDLKYVIVGGGPTGIELSGALPGYLKTLMKNHGIRDRKIHVDLIEAGPRLLPRLPKDASRMVRRQLKKLGVKIYLKSAVQGQTADGLTINGKSVQSHTVVWTAGVTNHSFFADNNFIMTARGKVAVDMFLQTEDNVFVIGDNANTPYSGMAQTALYDGAYVAENIIRRAEGKDFRAYKPKKPITVIPVGPNWAALIWGKIRLYGRLGSSMREAGDLVGFHDYQPWPKAIEQWSTGFQGEESCAVCLAAAAAR